MEEGGGWGKSMVSSFWNWGICQLIEGKHVGGYLGRWSGVFVNSLKEFRRVFLIPLGNGLHIAMFGLCKS